MSEPGPRDIARSTQDRLWSRAREEGRVYEDVLVRHALERFLHRLGRTHHRESFLLKGGLLLQVWTGLEARPTRDIDLLGPLGLDEEGVRELIRDCLAVDVEEDGWRFLASSELRVFPIREGAAYSGLRAVFRATLGKSEVKLQVDVGAGDDVVPDPEDLIMPTLLGQAPPEVVAYTPSTTVAEKLEAMLVLGPANSRVKDYFDIALLARTMAFDGEVLVAAIRACCERRGTALPEGLPVGLSEEFGRDEIAAQHWERFRGRLGEGVVRESWEEAVAACRECLAEPLRAAAAGDEWARSWPPGGPWMGR